MKSGRAEVVGQDDEDVGRRGNRICDESGYENHARDQ
jgi:hypothetical protein